jgi:hypothetical protein
MFRASSRGLIVNSGDLHHVLLSYMNCYNEVRTHLSLGKDAPTSPCSESWADCLPSGPVRTCVYRKLKSGYNGDEVRQGWRVNE